MGKKKNRRFFFQAFPFLRFFFSPLCLSYVTLEIAVQCNRFTFYNFFTILSVLFHYKFANVDACGTFINQFKKVRRLKLMKKTYILYNGTAETGIPYLLKHRYNSVDFNKIWFVDFVCLGNF
jgi:hypothetical protein